MLGLSQSASYAVRAMVCLAEDRCERGRVEEVADCSGVPAPYLAKLFGRLSQAGLIESRRGRAGGNWLARPPETISLMDVVEAIEGIECLGSCVLGDKDCSDARSCQLHLFWRATLTRIEREMRSITLADVIEFDLKCREDGGQCSQSEDRVSSAKKVISASKYEEHRYGSR